MAAILGLCARPLGNPDLYCHLVVETDGFRDWMDLPARAEKNGLGPLVYMHLKAIDALAPETAWISLRGLTLRHRRAGAAIAAALGEILPGLESQGIPVLTLKGAALAHLVYSEPGLRPMRDLDLLVRPEDAGRAQDYLCRIGFTPAALDGVELSKDHHHLPTLQSVVDGQKIHIEVHTAIFPKTRYYKQPGFETLQERSLSFKLGSVSAATLGYEDMLWHIYRHALGPPLLASPLRLIHLADMAGWVEAFSDRIDWDRMQALYPAAFNCLRWLHFLSPWPEDTLRRLPFVLPKPPGEVGLDYRGWPRRFFFGRRFVSLRGLVEDTLSPPDWWLRMFYGVGGPGSYSWNRWVRHPLHLVEWVGHFAVERLRTRSPGSELTRRVDSESQK